jgi:hypothetical protein
LLRLPAPGLRGTFAKAYALLALLVSKIGWDELLKTRSVVFVMEEEYRLHKTTASVDLNGHDEQSSTAAGRSPNAQPLSATSSDIPTIRISSESNRLQRNGDGHGGDVNVPDLEKPGTARSQAKEDASPGVSIDQQEGEEIVSAFSNKRLCERWLGE